MRHKFRPQVACKRALGIYYKRFKHVCFISFEPPSQRWNAHPEVNAQECTSSLSLSPMSRRTSRNKRRISDEEDGNCLSLSLSPSPSLCPPVKSQRANGLEWSGKGAGACDYVQRTGRIVHNLVPAVPKQPAKANILVKDVKLRYQINCEYYDSVR